MSLQIYECQNCGTPLTFPVGASSVACPSCRTTNYAPGYRETPAPSSTDKAKPSPQSEEIINAVNRQYKIDSLITELDRAKEKYQKEFLPAKEQAGRQLDREMADFEERLKTTVVNDKTSPFIFGGVFFMIAGVFCAYQGGIFEDGVIGWMIQYHHIPNDVMMFGFLALAVGTFMTVVGMVENLRQEDPKDKLRERKKLELAAAWQRWQDEDDKQNANIRALGGQIEQLKSS